MAARHHPALERADGVLAPRQQVVMQQRGIVDAAVARNRAVERRLAAIAVGLDDRQVRAQHRQQHLEQLGRLQDGGRDAAVLALHTLQEERVGERRQIVVRRSAMRRAAGRDEQPLGRPAAAAQRARHLERHEAAHAVAVEGEWLIEIRQDRVADLVDEPRQAGMRRLAEAVFTAGQLHGAHVNGRRQQRGPLAKERRAAAGVRQAEQPKPRGRVAADANRPGRRCAAHQRWRRRGCEFARRPVVLDVTPAATLSPAGGAAQRSNRYSARENGGSMATRSLVALSVKLEVLSKDKLKKFVFGLNKTKGLEDVDEWTMDFEMLDRAKTTDEFARAFFLDVNLDLKKVPQPELEATAEKGLNKNQIDFTRTAVDADADKFRNGKIKDTRMKRTASEVIAARNG